VLQGGTAPQAPCLFLPCRFLSRLCAVVQEKEKLGLDEKSGLEGRLRASVTAIQAISGTIERLSEISSTIAAAVEEQGAATGEISRNVQNAAAGTTQVSANISQVRQGASETGSASSQVLSAARSLSKDSNRLKLEVGKFLDTVRAA
jgi:methyl-accepting chemotaxis protein